MAVIPAFGKWWQEAFPFKTGFDFLERLSLKVGKNEEKMKEKEEGRERGKREEEEEEEEAGASPHHLCCHQAKTKISKFN